MYLAEITFKILKDANQEKQEELIENINASWAGNGQILDDCYHYAKAKKEYKMYQTIPEKDSLTDKYNNKYAKEFIEKLSSVGLAKPEITIIDNEEQEDDLCKCTEKTEFILYTTFETFHSPIRCKKCFKAIPLYKIPKLDNFNDDYYPINSWVKDYKACDSLQINCSVGVRFALKQMGSIDSQLTKVGLELCIDIEKLTGRDTYYYLYKYSAKSKKQELLRKCPKCGGKWLLDKPLHNIFDFECKKCKLLSNIGWDKR